MLLDPTLPEKQRARRRLVGAIALVVAAVVILPMVLDSHPKPVTDDISIDIPSRPVSRARAQNPEDTQAGVAPDNPAAPETAPGASNLVAAAPPAQTGAQAGAQAGTSGASGKIQQQAAVANNATGAASNTTKNAANGANSAMNSAGNSTTNSTTSSPAAPSAKPAARSNTATATAANTAQSPSASASARSSTSSSSTTSSSSAPTEPAAPPGSRFAVQLGSFPDDSSARAWESKLKAAGVPAYTEKRKQSDGSMRTLLRAGPFADRAAASAAIAKVREAGLTSGANNGSAQ
jgi:DedD protein